MADIQPIIEIKDIHKSFFVGSQEIPVLKGMSLRIMKGDFLVIIGPSGSGKSTLLHSLLGLEIPTTGEVQFFDQNMYLNTTEDDRSEMRKQHIGLVYQQPNWIRSMTVIENVAFPLILRGYRKELAHDIAYQALDRVNMTNWANQVPAELSGGQQQRVALSRCIVHNPEVVVADEPTGNLDFESGEEIMKLLQSLNVNNKKTVIMVTHDVEYLKYATCAIRVFNGAIAGYFTKDKMEDLIDQLHTKHLDKNENKQAYDKQNK